MEAVEQVPGVRLVDPARPAVIGDVLVYRRWGHLTDTYAGTMTHWLARRLPRLG